ncbi:lipid-A-disaccharide synthase [Magnetovibrio sp. PR-2]|uniref:lipid-A-disaccharide synthase n=1 Tax=Magnetovibrio sp. PR-2 TaxID=3120356 RepID=UPI002FCE4D66
MKVFVIAGENSGDALGASLMKSLTAKTDGAIEFRGVGGPEMQAQGLSSLFPMTDLAVMGVFEVLPRLRLLLKRMNQTAHAIEREKPDVVVTIDAPDFCFRVVKKLRKRHNQVPVVHYVAPSVWAWRAGRAEKVAKFLDHLLCLLPFEPPYFHKEGLDATFVGHPVVTGNLDAGDGPSFRTHHAIDPEAPLLCLLPGSRTGEVTRLLGVFGETASRLATQYPKLSVVIPSVDHLKTHIEEMTSSWTMPVTVVGPAQKADAFAASTIAIAASGTVTLELAMAKLPHVIGYRMNALTAMLARRLIKTPFVNLINICLGREAVPELLLENCTADNLAHELSRLMDDEALRNQQIDAATAALNALGYGGPSPGDLAADVVIKTARNA